MNQFLSKRTIVPSKWFRSYPSTSIPYIVCVPVIQSWIPYAAYREFLNKWNRCLLRANVVEFKKFLETAKEKRARKRGWFIIYYCNFALAAENSTVAPFRAMKIVQRMTSRRTCALRENMTGRRSLCNRYEKCARKCSSCLN